MSDEVENRITLSRLKSCLKYDPETGVFIWLQSAGRAKKGAIAGTISRRTVSKKYPRIQIQIDRKQYRLHQLAWLYMTGEWPDSEIDHKNRDATDNRWCNLRLSDPSQNGMNKGLRLDNKSGYKGVSFFKLGNRKKRWKSEIHYYGTRKCLGYFNTKEEAALAYNKAAIEYFGEFAYLNTIEGLEVIL